MASRSMSTMGETMNRSLPVTGWAYFGIDRADPDPQHVLHREYGHGYDLDGQEGFRRQFVNLLDGPHDQGDRVQGDQ